MILINCSSVNGGTGMMNVVAPCDGDHDDGDGWWRADAGRKCAEESTVTAITSS